MLVTNRAFSSLRSGTIRAKHTCRSASTLGITNILAALPFVYSNGMMLLSSLNFILDAKAERMIDPPLSAPVNGPHAYLGDCPFEARVGKRESKRSR
jgi:hypothetical protein